MELNAAAVLLLWSWNVQKGVPTANQLSISMTKSEIKSSSSKNNQPIEKKMQKFGQHMNFMGRTLNQSQSQ